MCTKPTMDTEEILLLKLSEEIRASALEDNATRCEQKLSEMESLLENSGHNETIEEIENYRHEIKVSGVSDVASELVYFTDSIIGNYIGDSISNLGPVDKIIIEDSDIDLAKLQERAGTNFIDNESLADEDPDQIVQRDVISRFNLDLDIEDVSGDLKILLAYMALEHRASLDYNLNALADIHSKISEKVDGEMDEFVRMRDSLDTTANSLEEIVSDDEIKSTDEIKANRPPRVKQELEDSSDQ